MENENKSAASDSADRLCWFCEHFRWSNAVEDWSDVTPGDDFEISCSEDHWRFDSFNTSVDEFRAMINTGKTCKDFVLLTELKRFLIPIIARRNEKESETRNRVSLHWGQIARWKTDPSCWRMDRRNG